MENDITKTVIWKVGTKEESPSYKTKVIIDKEYWESLDEDDRLDVIHEEIMENFLALGYDILSIE